MSIKLISEIWDNQDPQLTGSKLVIMLCLADHANDTGECWPSIARLAERARIAPANVTRHIKELEAAGYLTVTRTSGTHNTYVVSAAPRTNAIEPPAPVPSHPARQSNSTPARQRNGTPRASAMPPRAPAQPTPRASARPPRAPTRAEPSVNHQEPLQEPSGEPSARAPAEILPFVPADSRAARRPAAARLQALNAKLGPELRRPLADVVLQITGTAGLANTDTDSGYAVLYAAHEAAVTLYRVGYHAATDLLRAEEGWYAGDFRGKQGERPTLKQFVEWAAKAQAAPRGAKPNGAKDHASHRQPAPVSDTHDNEAALRRVLGLGPDDPIPEDDE